jgi:pantoate--beta-alanine ligase
MHAPLAFCPALSFIASMSPPAVFHSPQEYRAACDAARSRGVRVGLVPTMGALHSGHAALIAEAACRCPFVSVSIFVNPTQFGPGEDYSRYPRTLEHDLGVCERVGASCVFAPETGAMYPAGEATRVQVQRLSELLCGASRPNHFEGVATVVAKLLALTGPCTAVFGRKDYQQLRVIERMVRDLLLPVEVVGYRTVREADGLAMSSRNAYLDEHQRARAAEIPRALSDAVGAFKGGERGAAALRARVRSRLNGAVDSIDYVELADPETLCACEESATVGARVLLAVAVRVGRARLIDNVVLGEDPAPCGERSQ